MKLPDKVYDAAKWICLIVLPTVAWGYSQLAPIWNFPLAEEVPQTINLIATIAGIILGFSNATFKKNNNIIVEKKAEGILEDKE